MNGSTVFIAGIYGTGKSTLCSALSEKLHIPGFSASDLISDINGEQFDANKAVTDKYINQIILARRVQELNRVNKCIILAGHFCIFNSHDCVDVLPESVYHKLNISCIVLLEAELQTVITNLRHRDGREYSEESLSVLAYKEREQGERVSRQLKCPLFINRMTFTKNDIDHVATIFHVGG